MRTTRLPLYAAILLFFIATLSGSCDLPGQGEHAAQGKFLDLSLSMSYAAVPLESHLLQYDQLSFLPIQGRLKKEEKTGRIVFRARFPALSAKEEKNRLLVFNRAKSIRIFQENQSVYRWDQPAGDEMAFLHLVDLKPTKSPGSLFLDVQYEHSNLEALQGSIFLGSKKEAFRALLRKSMHQIVISSFLILIGIFSISFTLKYHTGAYLFFGVFALATGLNILSNSEMFAFIVFDESFAFDRRLSHAGYYLGSVSFFYFIQSVFGKGPLGIVSIFARLNALYALFAIPLGLLVYEWVEPLVLPFVLSTVLGGAISFLWVIYLSLRKNADAVLFSVGGLLFVFTQIWVALYKFEVVPFNAPFEWGVALFVASLGLVLVRRFIVLHTDLEAYSRELELQNIQIKRSVEERNKLAMLEKELEIARDIQFTNLPSVPEQTKDFKTAVRYIPATYVGGDLYDFRSLKEHQTMITILDVTGHGVPASLVASMVRMAFKMLPEHIQSPSQVLWRINQILFDESHGELITASTIVMDFQAMQMTVANAGHPPVLHIRKETGEIQNYKPKGKLMGWERQMEFQELTVPLQKGDRILLFTDGLIEATDAQGRELQNEGLNRFLQEHGSEDLDAMADGLVSFLKQRSSNQEEFEDDVTFIFLEVS